MHEASSLVLVSPSPYSWHPISITVGYVSSNRGDDTFGIQSQEDNNFHPPGPVLGKSCYGVPCTL